MPHNKALQFLQNGTTLPEEQVNQPPSSMNQVAELPGKKQQTGLSQLDQLKQWTRIVADTGDFGSIKEFAPQDATTNPSLIFKAAQMPDYKYLLDKAIADHRAGGGTKSEVVARIMDELLIAFGKEILGIIPARVSTETDARLSFDVEGLVAKGRRFIEMYGKNGIGRERILIKIASTWEGIRACEILQKEGINCNMTLLFSTVQAAACAEAKARLISPFVGRILDWWKAKTGKDYPASEDPGVVSVRAIYAYYKKFGYNTEVMGASFRNAGEILELAGSDLLTISPNLLAELKNSTAPVERKLSPGMAGSSDLQRIDVNEKNFRWLLNEDAMATEKTAEGIRTFNADAGKLEKLIEAKI